MVGESIEQSPKSAILANMGLYSYVRTEDDVVRTDQLRRLYALRPFLGSLVPV